MKRKTVVVNDPDLGRIELPDIRPVSKREWSNMQRRIRRALANTVAYPPGPPRRCPGCAKVSLEHAEDLRKEVIRGTTIVHVMNLHGARCHSCGREYLEPREMLTLDDILEGMLHPHVDAAVSRIGKGTVGTYWPKSVERALNLQPGDQLTVKIVSEFSAILQVRHGPDERSIMRERPPTETKTSHAGRTRGGRRLLTRNTGEATKLKTIRKTH